MKLLIDESIDVRFRLRLTGHDVFTVAYLKWKGIKNGALLGQAASGGFEALITCDTAMADQQNPQTLPLSLVVLHSPSNRLRHLEKLVPQILQELNHLRPRSIVHIPSQTPTSSA
jgi:hypothetical protein